MDSIPHTSSRSCHGENTLFRERPLFESQARGEEIKTRRTGPATTLNWAEKKKAHKEGKSYSSEEAALFFSERTLGKDDDDESIETTGTPSAQG